MTVSNTPGCGVEYPEHGDEAVAGAVCAAEVGAGCTDVAEALRHTSTRTPTHQLKPPDKPAVHADTASRLGDVCARLERVEDALDAVPLHRYKEAGGQLRTRRAGIEHGGRGVGEELLAHQVVALDHALHVVLVDADRNAHEQMLRALHDEVLDSQQVAERKS